MKLLRSIACGVLAAAAPLAAQAQVYSIHFNAPQVAAGAGEVARIGLSLENTPDRVTGFQFGVRHDASKLTFQSLDIGPALNTALGGASPDARFFFVNTAPAGGTGFTAAMILSADQAGVSLPPGVNHIFDAAYVIAPAATGDAAIQIAGDLGSPPVPVILDVNGRAQAPAGPARTTSATISVTGGPVPFRRGDSNLNRTFDVLDAILILDFLFMGGQFPAGQAARDGCVQIFNVDGTVSQGTAGVEDTADIDVTDAVYLLDFIFNLGAPPAAPFPGCGLSTTPAAPDVRCTSISCT
jgi:hypothetical protein